MPKSTSAFQTRTLSTSSRQRRPKRKRLLRPLSRTFLLTSPLSSPLNLSGGAFAAMDGRTKRSPRVVASSTKPTPPQLQPRTPLQQQPITSLVPPMRPLLLPPPQTRPSPALYNVRPVEKYRLPHQTRPRPHWSLTQSPSRHHQSLSQTSPPMLIRPSTLSSLTRRPSRWLKPCAELALPMPGHTAYTPPSTTPKSSASAY